MELRKAWARKQAGELAKLWIQTALYVVMMGGFAAGALYLLARPRWAAIAIAVFLAMIALYSVVIAVQDTRKWRANRDAPPPDYAAAVVAEDRARRSAVLVLLAANVPVAAGVAFLGWRMHEIVFLYWLETALSGAFTLLRLQRAELQAAMPKDGELPPRGKFVAGVFFLLFYSVFLLMAGVFLGAFFPLTGAAGEGPRPSVVDAVGGILGQPGGLAAFLAMAAAQVVAYRAYLRRGEFRVGDGFDVTAPAFIRLIGLTAFTVMGGFVVFHFGSTLAATAVFVAVRVFFELSRQQAEAARSPSKSDVTSPA